MPIEWPDFITIGAATVREVGLGFKLIHRADDDPERFGRASPSTPAPWR